MRLTTLFAGAGALVAFGVLGIRMLDLEQRIAVLDNASRAQKAGEPATSYTKSLGARSGTAKGVETRLQPLEQRVETLENSTRRGVAATGNGGADRLREEQSILSVIEHENSRVRDVQIEWHKARWLEARTQLLAAFASSQQLKPAQTSKLNAAIENELNGLVEVMKRPSFAEDPDQVANDWLGVLSETDHRAQEVLDPGQYQTWLQGRLSGRKILWPWLPDAPQETVQR